jgi:ribonucleoside-diphosphate reductase alpha subunit
MRVLKRDGSFENVCYDKITKRIARLCKESADWGRALDNSVDPNLIAQKVISDMVDGISTRQLDELAAVDAVFKTEHPDYQILAIRILISDLHKSTKSSFSHLMADLHSYVHPETGKLAPLISSEVNQFIQKHASVLDKRIRYERDFLYDYFGFKTLCKGGYLLKMNGKVVERPQHMLMRISCQVNLGDLEYVLKTYDALSKLFYTHATPTMLNAGSPRPQMSSCFLLAMEDDSIDGIYSTLSKCAKISKFAGGIGVSVSNVRAAGSYIGGTGGYSNGLLPMLRVYNNTARYVDQCFVGGTLVLTDQGEVAIENLKVGSRVLTHEGRFRPVTKLLSYEKSNPTLYKLNDSVIVTDEHPFLVIENATQQSKQHMQTLLNQNLLKPEWIAVKDLIPGQHWFLFPSDQKSKSFVPQPLLRKILIPPSAQAQSFQLYDLEVEDDHSYVLPALGIVHNGGGKRKGSFAMYLEPWHADIHEFLEAKKHHGADEVRARDLFYALWIPDLFMERVKQKQMWSLMCPNECPGLYESHGSEFEKLYLRYEREGKFRKQIPAFDLWLKILDLQIETGNPYLLFKDSCNSKSNQKHLGTIRGSNLCTEIIQFTSAKEVAVCNLASISLPTFISSSVFDFGKLHEVTKLITYNLNRVIDLNYYPVPEAKFSNMQHRPIGIGVQGFHDVLCQLKYSFDSEEAKTLNERIFETIYHASLESSNELAAKHGPYPSYAGSPMSQGYLQFDFWNPNQIVESLLHSSLKPQVCQIVTSYLGPNLNQMWDWKTLRQSISKHGVYNSLLVAPMPTQSTSQIMGNTEGTEIAPANCFVRETLAGSFLVVNKHLLHDLIRLGLWNEQMHKALIAERGSIQAIAAIPESLKKIYKTVWEVDMKVQFDRMIERSPYIDQSQSFNVYMPDPTHLKLTQSYFYAWYKGVKTACYYLRTQNASNAIQFTVSKEDKLHSVKSSGEKEKKSANSIGRGPKSSASTGSGPATNSLSSSASTNPKTLSANQMQKLSDILFSNQEDQDSDTCVSCGS